MWLCLFSGRQFEDTLENAQWRKVKLQQMWLCFLWDWHFENKFDNTHKYVCPNDDHHHIIINWWPVNWWPVRFFTHDPTRDWTTVSLQSNQRINLGNVLSLTVRLCKISGDGSGWYFRTFETLFHSTKVKTNHLIIRVGNPDEWCTQNCLPQDCLPVGISEVGNPEGNPSDKGECTRCKLGPPVTLGKLANC